MKDRRPLAIVVPAFKPDFFHQTIDSILNQTCKDFTLYVFDDAGPTALKKIVASYSDIPRLVYHRFDQNLGNSDLVAHWERCLDYVEEQWVWLFSDDDLMDDDCVQCFYQFIAQHEGARFVRFNTRIIDADNRIKQMNPPYPAKISSLDYLWGRLTHSFRSNAVEFVFQKKLLKEHQGFVNFPLAWCADDATWAELASEDGLYTIPGPCVSWRASEKNISSINTHAYGKQKFEACLMFLTWLNRFLNKQGVTEYKWQKAQVKWLYSKLNHVDRRRKWNTFVAALGRIEIYRNASAIKKIMYRLVWVELKIKWMIKGQ